MVVFNMSGDIAVGFDRFSCCLIISTFVCVFDALPMFSVSFANKMQTVDRIVCVFARVFVFVVGCVCLLFKQNGQV